MTSQRADLGTLLGTLTYMAPEVREALDEGKRHSVYDAFKSDVYSLGMTALSMAALQIFRNTTQDPIQYDVPASTANAINRLPYSEELKGVLREMIKQDMDFRTDFKQLHETLTERANKMKQLSSQTNQPPAMPSADQLKTILESLLTEKWQISSKADFVCPNIYLSQLEVVENWAKTKSETAAKAASYCFPYIPLSQILSDFAEEPTPRLTIKPAKALPTDPLPTIADPCGTLYAQTSPFPSFIVRKSFNCVTITEPATTHPVLCVRLKSFQERRLFKNQVYRLGTLNMLISDATQSQLSLQLGDNFEQSYSFTPAEAPIRIGRSADCHVKLSHSTLSKCQVEVKYAGVWILRNGDPTNGTWINCHTIANCDRESNEERLEDGSEVRDSDQQYVFFLA